MDDAEGYAVWFERAAGLSGGALTADDVARGYREGLACGAATVAGLLRPYGFTAPSAAYLYPGELDRPYPEAGAVLAALSRRYRLGVIANQSHGGPDRLARWGLREWLDVVVTSAEAGLSKPDPRVFTLALKQAGCEPGQAVMVGDRPDNDIAPAKRLGMATIRVRQGPAAGLPALSGDHEADLTVDRLADVPGVLGCALAP